jgi:hypothetical protein
VRPARSLAGVRSPPLRGGQAKVRRPCGESPEITRKAVFSEGRGLRVRIARHHEWRGPSLPPEVRREAGGLIGIHGEGVRPSSRACRARPSAGAQAKVRWPLGENAKIMRRVVFSEGRGLRARIAGPYPNRGTT